MRGQRLVGGLAAATIAMIGSVVAAPAASAAPLRGCPDGYFCFYYNSYYAGARADYFLSDGNLANETFNKGGTSGQGRPVKNNAASAVNNWTYYAVVYYNSNCNGSVASQAYSGYSSANLSPELKNDNASFKWPGTPAGGSDCRDRDQF